VLNRVQVRAEYEAAVSAARGLLEKVVTDNETATAALRARLDKVSSDLDAERRDAAQKQMAMQDRSRIEQSVLTMVREEASAKEAQLSADLAAVTQQVSYLGHEPYLP